MNYVGRVIRPPSEANVIILQVTVGCSYNKCKNELLELKSMGLDRVHMGLESGCDKVMHDVNRGETGKTMTAAERKIKESGIFLSVTTLLSKEVAAGTFILPTATEILHDLKMLISQSEGITCQFHAANHASSYLPLAGRLPRDKDTLLAAIDMALTGAIPLVPDYRRAL